MAPKYKLTYFPLRIIAEPIRFILAYAGVDFEDIRIERNDWPLHKKEAPFGTIPFIEFDGKKGSQSIPICRYLAKQYGLTPDNEWDDFQVDAMADAVSDLRLSIKEYYYEDDKLKKEQMWEKLTKETIPICYSKIDGMVKSNGGYVVGGKLTWGDLYITALLELFDHDLGFESTREYPSIAALRKKVSNLPAIKAWIARRPVTNR